MAGAGFHGMQLPTTHRVRNMFAHIELTTTYIAGARLLVRPVWPSRDGARQLHQPSRPRGELGMPPRLGRPRGYLPGGAPDEPPSPPAPTRQTGRRPHRVTSSRPPWWTMLNAVCSNAASTVNIACTVLQVASKPCLTISVSFGCAGF